MCRGAAILYYKKNFTNVDDENFEILDHDVLVTFFSDDNDDEKCGKDQLEEEEKKQQFEEKKQK